MRFFFFFVADSVFVNGAGGMIEFHLIIISINSIIVCKIIVIEGGNFSNFHTKLCHFRQYKWVYMCLYIMPQQEG